MTDSIVERMLLRRYFLARIERLTAFKQAHPTMDMEAQRLIAWSLISTYRDCCQLDGGAAAESMLLGDSDSA